MVIVEEVVHLWGMEQAWWSEGITSDDTSVCSWDTTVVVTEIIDVILLSILLQFCNSLLSI